MGDKFTVYVAGPISNTPDFRERFQQGMLEVAQLGHTPVSPLEVCGGSKLITWADAMKADIRALLACDGLYAMRGWEMSQGARIEHYLAHALGYTIIYQPEESTHAKRS